MLSGESLVDDVDMAAIPDGQVGFWWLGQHSFIVKLAGKIIYIDPYLTENPSRLVPPLVTAEDMQHADFVLGDRENIGGFGRGQFVLNSAMHRFGSFSKRGGQKHPPLFSTFFSPS